MQKISIQKIISIQKDIIIVLFNKTNLDLLTQGFNLMKIITLMILKTSILTINIRNLLSLTHN